MTHELVTAIQHADRALESAHPDATMSERADTITVATDRKHPGFIGAQRRIYRALLDAGYDPVDANEIESALTD